MTKTVTFRKIGVVGARGTKTQIQALRSKPGVQYVEAGAQPIRFFQETSNKATRGYEATQTVTGADGSPLTGKGVSVAVIDSGVDPTHPYFKEADGGSAVVANLKTLCDLTESLCTVQKVPNTVDTDTLSLGGHGTHVNGIVAGRPTTLTSGEKLQGAAPGAKLVSLSTGAGIVILGADAALNWVLENHKAPCGAGVSAATCPPIKVTNNSYGPTGGGAFDPKSATVKMQRALAAEGVVTVWANGNDGGDGSDEPVQPARHGPDRRHHLRRRRTSTRTTAPATARSRSSPRAARPATSRRTPTSRRRVRTSPPPAASTWRSARPGWTRATVPGRWTSARSTRSAAPRWRHRTSPASSPSCSRPTRRRPRRRSRTR